jgi:mannitol-1-phosphate 5-dehydrogenase
VPRYVFTAENSTTAAAELRNRVGDFRHTHYLDTVIGKMSKVFPAGESDLPPLTPQCKRGHLVEAFNDIYTSSAPGIDAVGIEGLITKSDLKPFEEAKLYGHNTSHFMLAYLLSMRGCDYMDEANQHQDLVAASLAALTDECGAALCRKHRGADAFFKQDVFQRFAENLVYRMISPILRDSIERVIRDPERKLGWDDRLIGAIRLCFDQDFTPSRLLAATATIAKSCLGPDQDAVTGGLKKIWEDAPHLEANRIIEKILAQEALV